MGKALKKSDIEAMVFSEIADHFAQSSAAIDRDTDLFLDLGADSLDFVELIMLAEETFDITVVESAVKPLTKVGDWIDYIYRRIKECRR